MIFIFHSPSLGGQMPHFFHSRSLINNTANYERHLSSGGWKDGKTVGYKLHRYPPPDALKEIIASLFVRGLCRYEYLCCVYDL